MRPSRAKFEFLNNVIPSGALWNNSVRWRVRSLVPWEILNKHFPRSVAVSPPQQYLQEVILPQHLIFFLPLPSPS